MTDDKIDALADTVITAVAALIDRKQKAAFDDFRKEIAGLLELDARMKEIESGGPSKMLESLERHASRHADHLSRLELRLKRLET